MEFQIRPSLNSAQPYYWRIVAANGKILANSETYVHKQDAIDAAWSVKANAGTSSIVDYTRQAVGR